MPETVPTDVVGDELVGVYRRAVTRLGLIVAAGLRRGLDPTRVGTPAQRRGDATLRYREQQLEQALALLDDLSRRTATMAPRVAQAAYLATLRATDRHEGITAGFGTVHTGAVQALAINMTGALRGAVDQAGEHVAAVFARADAIDGALRTGRNPGPLPFLGRRQDDPYRRVALETVAQGIVGLDTRRQVSAQLARNLITEGVTDATTGFIDRGGRRWNLATYTEMVARTTTREATVRATVNRLLEAGTPIVQVSSHEHKADVCSPYDGNTYALTAQAAAEHGLPRLERLPPFHPRCVHIVAPGRGNLEAFERELGIAADEQVTPAPRRQPKPPDLVEPARPPQPPFGITPPVVDHRTADRLEAQRVQALIDNDPGPEPGYRQAWRDAIDLETAKDRRATPYAELDRAGKIERTHELTALLGADLLSFIRQTWGKDQRLEDRFVAGDLSRDDLEQAAEAEHEARYHAQILRDQKKEAAQFNRRAIPCFSCGRFKRRPADVCDTCGDDPVAGVNYAGGGSHSGDYWQKAAAMNRSYGYDATVGSDP